MPDQLAPMLVPHDVSLARKLGWSILVNGLLLREAERAAFEVMITGDKSIVKQQNNRLRSISLVVVGNTDRIVLIAHAAAVLVALDRAFAGSFELVPMPGTRDFMKVRAGRENKQ